jgi:hypothetical protein
VGNLGKIYDIGRDYKEIHIDGGRRDILQKRSLVSKVVNGESFED